MSARYYNDKGEVGVIVSYGYGAGWSTWSSEADPFDPVIIQAILDGKNEEELDVIAKIQCPGAYTGGLDGGATVRFLPQGTKFKIMEYDGAESLEYPNDIDWLVA